MLCSRLKLFSTVLGTTILFSGICAYADTIALESDGISIEAEDYVSIREDEGFTYLYTMEDDSIPYVIVGSYPECTVPIADDFTEQMMEPNYKDLQVVAGPEEQVIGENTFEKITYSYTIQDRYEVTDERLFIQYGNKVLMFGSKEVPDAGYKNPDGFLEHVAESFKPLAGGGDDYNLILHNDSDDTIKETGSDPDGLSQPDLRGLESYTESDNGDGSYTYYFEQCGLSVTMPEEFYQETRVIADIASVTWVHKDSYEAYLKEGMTQGGRLFTIGYSVQSDFMNLPGYTYLGFDENETANWYFSVPTDYQAYIGDDGIQDEYNKLNHMTDEIRESIKIEGIAEEIATPGANITSTESEAVALTASPITWEYMTIGKTVSPSDFPVVSEVYNCNEYCSLGNPLHLSLRAVSPDKKINICL